MDRILRAPRPIIRREWYGYRDIGRGRGKWIESLSTLLLFVVKWVLDER